jgi:FSR family fosmidomycin resistance protein-like MFS transporter
MLNGWQLAGRHEAHAEHKKSEAARPAVIFDRKYVTVLALVGGLQAWTQQNMITFVPKYLHDIGQSPVIYGLVAGLFMGGSAIGNLMGGAMADKYGKQRVAMTVLLLASAPLAIISQIGWSPWLYVLVPLAGLLTGSVHSIVVVLAQRALPMGMATASGLTLGFIFSVGALGTLLCGPLADKVGWPPVFLLTAGLALGAALLTLALRDQN